MSVWNVNIGLDLGPNCLQRLSPDDTIRHGFRKGEFSRFDCHDTSDSRFGQHQLSILKI